MVGGVVFFLFFLLSPGSRNWAACFSSFPPLFLLRCCNHMRLAFLRSPFLHFFFSPRARAPSCSRFCAGHEVYHQLQIV